MRVWKLRSVAGSGWVRQLLDGFPIVTGDEAQAAEWDERGAAIADANTLNRRRFVQWRAIECEPTPGGPRRFVP